MAYWTNNNYQRRPVYSQGVNNNQGSARYQDLHYQQPEYAETVRRNGNHPQYYQQPGFYNAQPDQTNGFPVGVHPVTSVPQMGHVGQANANLAGMQAYSPQSPVFSTSSFNFQQRPEPTAVSENQRYLVNSGNYTTQTAMYNATPSNIRTTWRFPVGNSHSFPNSTRNENNLSFVEAQDFKLCQRAPNGSRLQPRPHHVSYPVIPTNLTSNLLVDAPRFQSYNPEADHSQEGISALCIHRILGNNDTTSIRATADDLSFHLQGRKAIKPQAKRVRRGRPASAPYMTSAAAPINMSMDGNTTSKDYDDEIPGLYTKMEEGRWMCTFKANSGTICGHINLNRRNRGRHVGIHAKEEKDLIDRNELDVADAVAYPRQKLLKFTCLVPQCGYALEKGKVFHIEDYRIDNKRAAHNNKYHPELMKIGKRKGKGKEREIEPSSVENYVANFTN